MFNLSVKSRPSSGKSTGRKSRPTSGKKSRPSSKKGKKDGKKKGKKGKKGTHASTFGKTKHTYIHTHTHTHNNNRILLYCCLTPIFFLSPT